MTRKPHHSLSYRLAWLTVAVVLLSEALVLLPSLTRARRFWLEQRLREAEIAALSASVGVASNDLRMELLHLAGVHAVRVEQAGVITASISDGADFGDGMATDLRQESWADGLGDTLGRLLRVNEARMNVQGASPLRDGAIVTFVAERRDLDRYLGQFARRMGWTSLLVAAAAGVLLYVVLLVVLVRPMRRLTESISAFGADPEHATPLDPATLIGGREDEVALAARELAAMQQELRTALWRNARLAALGTAVAKVNHDLRGILSPALLTAERLQMNPQPSIKKAGDTLVRAVERATELISQTVAFAREVPFAPARTRMGLRSAVTEAAESACALCRGLSVANDIAADIELDAEPQSVARVIGNLLRNAGEARASRVRVTAEADAAAVAILVQDDGPGLPAAVRETLFRPFTGGGRPGGAGLGLAIVRDLVRAHGGDVVLEETGPEGTRFRLTLPRAQPRPQPFLAVSADTPGTDAASTGAAM
jgi:signal transduction histidine kinase